MTEHYPLRPFRIVSRNAIDEIITTFPLATLITGSRDTADLSLVPLMLDVRPDGKTTLTGHLDRNNPQIGKLEPGQGVSFVFSGPNSYASPDIYPDPQLPGWFYVMVKGVGTVSRLIRDADAVDMLCDATKRFGGPQQQFGMQKNDPRFELFIGGIVGFEIEVDDLVGIAKLAQDKGPTHSKLACQALSRSGSTDLSEFLLRMRDSTAEPRGN